MSRTIKQIRTNWNEYGTIDNEDGKTLLDEIERLQRENSRISQELVNQNDELTALRRLKAIQDKAAKAVKEKDDGKHRGRGRPEESGE